MDLIEVKTIMLPWPQVSDILSECATKHLGHEIICKAIEEGDDYWCCQLQEYKMPLPELCTLMHFSGLPAKDWDDTLPDEGGSTVDGFGMLFCDYLISHHLGLGWKYRVIGKEGLWLVDVSDKVEHKPEPALIDGKEVPFEELKSKDELFNFFEEGSCTHAGLMEFCEDYKKRYDTDLCWPYPIAGDNHLGTFLVLVREGVLCLPYDGFDGESYEFFNLEGAKLLTAKQIAELSKHWKTFSNGLIHAMTDMEEYLSKNEGAAR